MTTALILAAFALQPTTSGAVVVDRVDVIEVNTHHDDEAAPCYVQIIYWRWSDKHSRHKCGVATVERRNGNTEARHQANVRLRPPGMASHLARRRDTAASAIASRAMDSHANRRPGNSGQRAVPRVLPQRLEQTRLPEHRRRKLSRSN
jgi:hypothetical protein